jgi:hypothetical protein
MKAACSEEVPNRAKCERGSAADCQSRVARANPCLAGRGHRLADERTFCSEMAEYQLPIKRDQRHTGLLLVAAARFLRKPRRINITTEDLGYQEHSPEKLASENLLDLNTTSPSEFLRLGLDGETSERIVDNRPYRNKMDLLSRMSYPKRHIT